MFVFPLVTCTILLTMLLMFLLNTRQRGKFRSFVHLSICTLWWHGSWIFLLLAKDSLQAEAIAIVGHVGILYLPIAYRSLYAELAGYRKKRVFWNFVYALLLCLLFFTDTIISGVNTYSWGYYPKAGVLHPVFLLLVTFVVIESIVKTAATLGKTSDRGRSSSLAIAMAAGIMFSAGSVDFLLNYDITIFAKYPIGFVATITFILINAVGISRFNLYQQEFMLADLRQRNDGLQGDLDHKIIRLAESEKLLVKISRQNEELKLRDQIISAFLPPAVRRELSMGMNPLDYQPNKLSQSVIFFDLRDYTALSEKAEIEEVYSLLNRYFDLVNHFVYSHFGEVNKYLGDGALCLFSAPEDCLAAIVNFYRALDDFNDERRKTFSKEIRIGIGVSFGEVLSANFGSEWKVERSVIGDVVNIASRLEQLTKSYGCQVIADFEFIRQLKDYRFARPIGVETLKGKSIPIRIFEIFEHCSSEEITRKIATRSTLEFALEAFIVGDWEQAMGAIESVDKDERVGDKPLHHLHQILVNTTRRRGDVRETA